MSCGEAHTLPIFSETAGGGFMTSARQTRSDSNPELWSRAEISADNRQAERLNALSEVAYMYYCLDMTQKEIAKRTSLSRPHISRLLKRAKEEGVVEIRLNFHGARSQYSEMGLIQKFGLAGVHVYNCEGIGEDERREVICRYGAQCVESMLRPGMSVGITRGAIMGRMIHALKGDKNLNLKVVQIMGGEAVKPTAYSSATELIGHMVNLFGGTPVYLDAPLYIENDFVRNNLVREPFIRQKLEQAMAVEMVITSIRPIYHGMQNHVWSGFVDDDQVDDMLAAGGVGYLLGRAFDINGELIDHPVNRRIIGIHPKHIKSRSVVGIAFGEEYAEAVLGALRGGYITTLITDFTCANRVLSLAERK